MRESFDSRLQNLREFFPEHEVRRIAGLRAGKLLQDSRIRGRSPGELAKMWQAVADGKM